MLTKLTKIKKLFRTSRQIQQEQWDKPYKEITNRHFNPELIDWNVQTSMYALLTSVIYNIDDVHLKIFARSYKDGWNECIEVQLRDAIKDVLKHKKLI
jgi:hypothetical protein